MIAQIVEIKNAVQLANKTPLQVTEARVVINELEKVTVKTTEADDNEIIVFTNSLRAFQ